MPATATLPGPVTVNEMVAGWTGSENVAVSAVVVATLDAPGDAAVTDVTVGGVVSGG